jgi:hypothetical protein
MFAGHHGATRKGNGDTGAQLQGIGCGGSNRQGQKGVLPIFLRGNTAKAPFFYRLGRWADGV